MKNTKEIKERIEDLKEDIETKTKDITEDIKEKTEEILNDVKDSSKKFDKKDIEENKAMAALSYIIAPVPYFTETKSKWVHYHAIQGMNLFIIFVMLCLAVTVLNSFLLWPFPYIKTILRTILFGGGTVFAIIGIVNVCNGQAKELPIINKFKIIKK